MAQEVKISSSQLHILNEVRRTRTSLGISTEELSKIITQTENTSTVQNIESSTDSHFYTDLQLKRAIEYFTQVSGEKYVIHSFYPQENFKEELVPKVLIDIKTEFGPVKAIETLLSKTDFLNTKRTIREITAKCNEDYNKDWKPSDFTSTLERFRKLGKLEYSDSEEFITYRKI
ncbi:hypothetical protein [Algoriphagus sp.]|uniref:hypothetical protein n=1 Tax=Algoriphagus sp. TaxID=1872435 RepID=UPI003F716FE6